MKKHNPGCNCCTPTACNSSVWVKGCYALPVGSGITVNLKINGTTVYSSTTNSTGYAAYNSANGVYDVEVVDSRSDVRWNTHTFSNASLTCNSTYVATLTNSVNSFYCTNFCGDPLKDTLYVTDPNGTWTITNTGNGVWKGCASHTSMANVVTALAPGTCVRTNGTGTVDYLIELLYNTVGYKWTYLAAPPAQTMSTGTCANGVLNTDTNVDITCILATGQDDYGGTPTANSCPPSVSLTFTMANTSGSLNTANPGAGLLTITE